MKYRDQSWKSMATTNTGGCSWKKIAQLKQSWFQLTGEEIYFQQWSDMNDQQKVSK